MRKLAAIAFNVSCAIAISLANTACPGMGGSSGVVQVRGLNIWDQGTRTDLGTNYYVLHSYFPLPTYMADYEAAVSKGDQQAAWGIISKDSLPVGVSYLKELSSTLSTIPAAEYNKMTWSAQVLTLSGGVKYAEIKVEFNISASGLKTPLTYFDPQNKNYGAALRGVWKFVFNSTASPTNPPMNNGASSGLHSVFQKLYGSLSNTTIP